MKLLFATFFIFSTSFASIKIYSQRQEFLLRPFLKEFEKATGEKVDVVYLKKGLLTRVRTEKNAPKADVLISTSLGPLEILKEENLLYKLPKDVKTESLPKNFVDADRKWVGLSARARILYVSKDFKGKVKSYEDLANPELKGKICMRSGLHPYNIDLFSSYIFHHGKEKTEQWLKGLKENLARRPRGNDRAQVKAIKEGVCKVAIGNSYYMGKMLGNEKQKAWAESSSIYFPNQKSFGTHINLSGIALLKKADPKAIKLVNFLLSEKVQKMYAELNHEYPVRPKTPLSDIVRNFGKEQEGIKNGRFKMDETALSQFGQYKKDAVELVNKTGLL